MKICYICKTSVKYDKEQQDIRWQQRFSNYRKALRKLAAAVEIVTEESHMGHDIDELLQEGLIQRFEYTHEMAWKVMKDYEEYQGYHDIRGSRDAIRQALQIGIITDERWMHSIVDRNLTSHTYNDESADKITANISEIYFPLFVEFERKMNSLLEPGINLFEQ